MEAGSNEAQVSALCKQADDEFEGGRYRFAMPLYKQALELGEATMDIDDRLDVYETLAVCCHRLKFYDGAVTYNRTILGALESSAAYGYDHEATLNIRYKLARALSASSKLDRAFAVKPKETVKLKEAVKLYKQNLKIMAANGASSSTVSTRWSLASVLVKLSRHLEAELIYKRLMREEKGTPGLFRLPESLELKHEYYGVLYHLGRYQESKTHFLKLQDELSAFCGPKTRKLKLIIRSTDRYIAACVEATADIELGSLRSLTATARRNGVLSSAMPHTTASKMHLPHRMARVANATGAEIPVSHSKAKDGEGTNSFPAHVKLGETQNFPSNGTTGSNKPKVISVKPKPVPQANSLLTPANLSILNGTTAGVRHSISDQAIGQTRTALKPGPLITRPKSAQPPGNTQVSNNNPRVRIAQATEGHANRSRGSNLRPQTPIKHPSSSTAGSTPPEQKLNVPQKVSPKANALEVQPTPLKPKKIIRDAPAPGSPPVRFASPMAPNKNKEREAIIPPRSRRSQVLPSKGPVSRPVAPKASVLARDLRPTQHISPLGLGIANGSSRRGGKVSLTAAKTISPLSTSDPGESYGAPQDANDADKWFLSIRRYAHTLFNSAPPKNQNWKPVRVAIIDSGLSLGDKGVDVPMAGELRRKRRIGHITYKDCTGSSKECIDSAEGLHGTWCALLLLQMAPHAKLYIANVSKPNETGQDPDCVADAIAWAITQDVDIINMSFGWHAEKPNVSAQIDIARQKEILIFAAASNESIHAPKYGVFPANNPTVHGIYSCSGSGYPSTKMNPRPYKDKPSFMFPGEQVAVLTETHQPFKDTERLDGTSFATPIATGTAALVLQLARQQLTHSVKEVERRLKKYEGISDVFMAMSGDAQADGYYHVMPWRILGFDKPIPAVGVNESHQWFTLMQILGVLRRFGDYKDPLE